MKKNMTIQMNENTTLEMIKNVTKTISNTWYGLTSKLANYYSEILEEEISPRKATKILQAQFAFLSVLLTSGGPILLCAACVAWFGLSLINAKD